MPTTDLTGQVALVTGASAGLGRHFARTLAEAGAAVALAARRADKLDQVRAEIEAIGGRCLPVALDVTDTDQITAAVHTIELELGPVQILVNNAGVTDAVRAHKMPLDLIDLVIDTNIRGPYILACEVARRLIAANLPGRIVNLSSMGAYHYDGTAAATLYSISKAANVRMTDGMLARIGDPSEHYPRRRIADPAMLDGALLLLCSPTAEAVTGTVIKVDDGQAPR